MALALRDTPDELSAMSPTPMVSPSRAGASLKEGSDIAELAGGRGPPGAGHDETAKKAELAWACLTAWTRRLFRVAPSARRRTRFDRQIEEALESKALQRSPSRLLDERALSPASR